jgi:large subunit ribosomal protein L4
MAEGTVTLPVVSQSRAKVGDVEVPAAVVAGPVREHLLYEAVRSHMASRRSGTVATKTKGLVSGGGKKPWRQKGTGRARAGSSRSPLWAGGGTIFGPRPRDWSYRLPKSARRAALRAALAARHREERLLVVDKLELPEAKTKHMVETLRELGVDGGSVLIVLAGHDDAVERATRNLPRAHVRLADGLGVYDILGHVHLVLTRDALVKLVARLGGDVGGAA